MPHDSLTHRRTRGQSRQMGARKRFLKYSTTAVDRNVLLLPGLPNIQARHSDFCCRSHQCLLAVSNSWSVKEAFNHYKIWNRSMSSSCFEHFLLYSSILEWLFHRTVETEDRVHRKFGEGGSAAGFFLFLMFKRPCNCERE